MKFPIDRVKIFLAAFIILLSATGPAFCAAKQPEFASSGIIGGTPLTYESLVINKHGIVSVTICNPTHTALSFSANFSFIDKKGNHLTGFTAKGLAMKNTSTSYFYEVDYAKFKKTAAVKVLGRSGRSSE